MIMTIDSKYEIGQTVFLITDTDQLSRIVTSITITKRDIVYSVQQGTIESRHYDYEMSAEKNILING